MILPVLRASFGAALSRCSAASSLPSRGRLPRARAGPSASSPAHRRPSVMFKQNAYWTSATRRHTESDEYCDLRTVSIMNSLQLKLFSNAMRGLLSLFKMLVKSACFDRRVSEFKFSRSADQTSIRDGTCDWSAGNGH